MPAEQLMNQHDLNSIPLSINLGGAGDKPSGMKKSSKPSTKIVDLKKISKEKNIDDFLLMQNRRVDGNNDGSVLHSQDDMLDGGFKRPITSSKRGHGGSRSTSQNKAAHKSNRSSRA